MYVKEKSDLVGVLKNNESFIKSLDSLVDLDSATIVIEQDMFSTMARVAAMCSSIKEFKEVTKKFEAWYRKQHKRTTAMPGRYRSAKSVLVSAMSYDVPIMRHDRDVPYAVGKTALEKQITAKRRAAGTKADKGQLDKLVDSVNAFNNEATATRMTLPSSLPDADRRYVTLAIDRMEGELRTLKDYFSIL